MKDINPIISVVNGKLCINGKIFEHNELRESKEYLQSIGAEEAHFYPDDEDQAERFLNALMSPLQDSHFEISATIH